MRIDLNTDFFDASLYSSITLRDPSCTATVSSKLISLASIPSQCRSSRKETNNRIIYENEVIMQAKQTAGMVTREIDRRVRFTCSYNKNGVVSSVSFKPISNVNVTEGRLHHFICMFGPCRRRCIQPPLHKPLLLKPKLENCPLSIQPSNFLKENEARNENSKHKFSL